MCRSTWTVPGEVRDTLTLNNLKILFQPAPEPASIAVFLSALGALATCRRRLRRSGMHSFRQTLDCLERI